MGVGRERALPIRRKVGCMQGPGRGRGVYVWGPLEGADLWEL